MKNLEEMTPSEQRIAIAQDVLERLESRKYKAARGIFLRTSQTNAEAIIGAESTTDAQAVLKGMSCTVCAVGSLFISTLCVFGSKYIQLDFGEALPMDSRGEGEITMRLRTMQRELDNYFSGEQRRSIEQYFEGTSSVQGYQPEKALQRLAENIIRNEGVFVWQQEEVAPAV